MKLQKSSDCGSYYYFAELSSFTPDVLYSKNDALPEEAVYRCSNNYPYLTKYYLKEGLGIGHFKAASNVNSDVHSSFDKHDDIVKIKTINSEWLYAAVYDENKKDKLAEKRGYVRLTDITPFYELENYVCRW
ncbi:hypothetical protein [Pantoea sp. B65]|uniref:hypothetical protein n=1 Tax=Pantoea sp. B65 TaxID=2813359 RepID=UPI0039B48B48